MYPAKYPTTTSPRELPWNIVEPQRGNPGKCKTRELRINWATALDCGLISDDLGKVGGDKKLRMYTLFGAAMERGGTYFFRAKCFQFVTLHARIIVVAIVWHGFPSSSSLFSLVEKKSLSYVQILSYYQNFLYHTYMLFKFLQ